LKGSRNPTKIKPGGGKEEIMSVRRGLLLEQPSRQEKNRKGMPEILGGKRNTHRTGGGGKVLSTRFAWDRARKPLIRRTPEKKKV